MHRLTLLAAVSAVLLSSGCGLMEDRTDRYMIAQKGEPLVVPEWYSERRLRDRYPVPEADLGFVAMEEFEVPEPPEPGLEILQEQFVIKATDTDTWLLASEAPGKIWPALKKYWEEQGAVVQEISTSTGDMLVSLSTASRKATGFITDNNLAPKVEGESLNLRIRVQQGLKRKSSEIRIGLDSNALSEDERLVLLGGVKSYLDENADSLESYSLVAQNIGGEDKLALINELGEDPFIRVSLDYERAWFAVGEALNDSQVSIIDLNRTEGVYYVRFGAEEEGSSGGVLSWFGGNNQDLLSDRFNFRVELSRNVDGIRIVSVPTRDDVDPQDGLRLLNQLLDHLS